MVSYCWNVSIFVLSNFFFMIIYKAEHPFFEQFKIQKDEPWPWQADPKQWRDTLNKTLKVVVFNNLVCLPTVLYLGAALHDFRSGTSFSVEDLPTSWTLLWQFYFIIFFEDLMFCLSHRLLHTRFLYKHVHKLHHTYTQPVGLCAEYAHPLEFVFGNVLPIVLPMTLLGKSLHQFTFLAIGT